MFSAALAAFAPGVVASRPAPAPPSDGWPAYGGGPEQIRYSSLDADQPRATSRQLEVAWTYDSGETGGLQTNPIVVDGVLYTTTPKHRVVALDAATGTVRWTFDSGIEGRGPNRGVTYWSSGDERAHLHGAGTVPLRARRAHRTADRRRSARDGRIDLREDLGRDPRRSRCCSRRPASSTRIC